MPSSFSSSSSSDDEQLTAEQAIREAPMEVLYEGTEYYRELGKESDLREPYRLPQEVVEGLFKKSAPDRPPAPLLVFINSRSGGRAGPELTRAFQRALGYTQVFDLGTFKPDRVLNQIFTNLDKIAQTREVDALHMRQSLRIVACGGDGTVAWVLQTIGRLGLTPPPPVAVVPLGTGNDLARSFGWGGSFEKAWIKDHAALHTTLGWFGRAATAPLDRWRLSLTAPGKGFFTRRKPYGFISEGPADEAKKFTAESWNYVSIGMDAKSAFGFHHLRENNPGLAFSRAANQAWYGYFSCASGWFCGAEPINHRMRLEVVHADGGSWEDVEVGASIKAIVLLNLQSYGGGRNIWGEHDTEAQEKGFKKPTNSDGLVEVVGFKSGFHAGAVMSGTAHGVRLAQARGVRVHVRGSDEQRKTNKNGMGKMYLQLDGEPWKQDVPDFNTKEEMLVELEYGGQSQLLVRPGTGNHQTATTAAAAAAEAQHLDKLASIKASNHHKGGAVAPAHDHADAKKKAKAVSGAKVPSDRQVLSAGQVAAEGAGKGAPQLPQAEEVATRHGASPSAGSELPTPVPQLPTSEGGVSPQMSGMSPPGAVADEQTPDDDADGADGALDDVRGAVRAAADADEGPVSGFEGVQEGTMRATETESTMRAPGPQSVLQSVDYDRGM